MATSITARWEGRTWALALTPEALTISSSRGEAAVPGARFPTLTFVRGWFRWRIVDDGRVLIRLAGATDDTIAAIVARVTLARTQESLDAALRWSRRVEERFGAFEAQSRWFPREELDDLVTSRPTGDLTARLRAGGALDLLDEDERAAIAGLDADLAERAATQNRQVLERERKERAAFFRTIERRALSAEQSRAVITFDNRVQVVAAAGSGKTSVMVARAAYAAMRGFVPPERILLLAFNKAAADELQVRITERFTAAGLDPTGVRAVTLHAFGLDVIGHATGRRPTVASWSDDGGRESERVAELIEGLKTTDPTFARVWDEFRLLYGPERTRFGEGETADDDGGRSARRYRTLNGEDVRSSGELRIADWLYLNHVAYEYERPYRVDTATEQRRQYRPDFHYPEVDTWHEHWALDRHGRPPADASFAGYLEDVAWKRALHRQHGTRLIETSWSGIMEGDDFARLEQELQSLGVEPRWDPARAGADPEALRDKDLAKLIRTFMRHVKAGGWTRDALERALQDRADEFAVTRTRVFLSLYWAVHEAWERALAEADAIDFEDMLLRAAQHLHSGAYEAPYDLILVDEFQDSSRARAALVQGLLRAPGRYLLAVGDDWQSINRFAGADVAVMLDFEELFGEGPRLKLETTFRCTQTISDVASDFIQRNPRQLTKTMRAKQRGDAPPIRIIGAKLRKATDEDPRGNDRDATNRRFRDTVRHVLDGLEGSAENDPNTHAEPLTVFVLGRYWFEREQLMPARAHRNLSVRFLTVHSSKGLEADVVIIPRLTGDRWGFPSDVEDDPVLGLVMSEADAYPHAEERRLFYVALTRARREVIIVADDEFPSTFVHDLLPRGGWDGRVTTEDLCLAGASCPECTVGTLELVVENVEPQLSGRTRTQERGVDSRPTAEHARQEIRCSARPRCQFRRDAPAATARTRTVAGGGAGSRSTTANRPAPGARRCPECTSGVLVERTGQYGRFLSCSNFRGRREGSCRYSESLPAT